MVFVRESRCGEYLSGSTHIAKNATNTTTAITANTQAANTDAMLTAGPDTNQSNHTH